MKKILLMIGLVACMGANAFQLEGFGMKHVQLPKAVDFTNLKGDKRFNHSSKFASKVPTLNFSHTSQKLLSESTLARMHMGISTGHYSDVLTVSPSIQPRLEIVKELAEDMFVIVNFNLPTIGKIKEKSIIGKDGAEHSHANGLPWTATDKASFKDNKKDISMKFQWKFHAPWGSKEFNND